MVFSSLIFLYGFWGLSVLACGLCRSKEGRNRSLLIASLIFYAWGEPKYVLLLMLMAFVSWLCALKIDRAETPGVKKLWLWLCVVVDLGLIGYFKYAGLFFGSLAPFRTLSAASPCPLAFPFTPSSC